MKRKLLFIIVLLCLASVGWGAWDLYQPYRGYGDPEFIEITPRTGAPAIVDLLVSRGVLAHRWPFLVRYWVMRSRHRLKAGEYYFDRPLRPIDVYRKLILGDVFLYSVVVPEGSDRFDVARILSDRMAIDPAEFLRRTESTALIHDLDPAAPTLEGYLFPDTYRFPRRVTPDTIISTMVARFRHIMKTKLPEEFASSPRTLHAAVTLASLVEKETPDPAERPVVAGVFARRLKLNMPLQCDPTVVYAARVARRPIDVIHSSDLRFDSPFNTYVHSGLPPGPISNPGERSLRAAFHPADGDELYFVSNNHGGHLFAKTLAEHERNVAKYRAQERERKREAKSSTQDQGAGSQKRGRRASGDQAQFRRVDIPASGS